MLEEVRLNCDAFRIPTEHPAFAASSLFEAAWNRNQLVAGHIEWQIVLKQRKAIFKRREETNRISK